MTSPLGLFLLTVCILAYGWRWQRESGEQHPDRDRQKPPSETGPDSKERSDSHLYCLAEERGGKKN